MMAAAKANELAVKIRPVRLSDAEAWQRLRCDLWPEGREDHAPEIASFFAATLEEPSAVLVAENPDGEIIAIAELSIRTDLSALVGTRVGYVGGLYVIPEARGRGVARSLLVASRDWARQQNCGGFASDRADRVIIDRRHW
jgi:aminoglycoside 6'-N-acetyltransferase I